MDDDSVEDGDSIHSLMQVRTVRALRGPNVWSRATALEATVALGAPPPGDLEARLRATCPALLGPQPAPLPTLAHALERLTLGLQAQAGCAVAFSLTAATAEPDVFKVVVQYGEEDVGRRALELARELLGACLAGRPFDLAGALAALRSLDEQVRLGPSTGSIVRAAERRGIPVRRLNDGSLVQLGWGARQHRILPAETDHTSAIGESIAQDKELTKTLLRAVGVPVPDGQPAESAEQAWEVACDLGLPVVVKPQHGNQGRGVAVNLRTREQVLAAWSAAREEGRSILVERFAPGADHRLLVIGGKLVAAARRDPPQVRGDGVHTVEELVAKVNADPRRGEDHATSLSKIRLDAIGLGVLAEQGYSPASVPPAGMRVLLRRNANLSTGGTAADVTDQVHPEVAARAVEAARVIGLDVAGVDVVCEDVAVPLEEQGGVVVEVNAAPGFRMHLEPSSGTPRAVGEAVIGTMFGPGEDGRIPLVTVAGTNGKTTTTRLIAHLLRTDGKRVGMTCTDGIYLDERRIDSGDCSGPKSARSVLLNPMVDAAVLETARGGILREGLGFDRCDVAVVTNIGAGDHLGLNGIATVEELARVKRTIVDNVSPSGAAVLNAADPLTAEMASHCPGKGVFFAREASHPVLAGWRAKGHRVVFTEGGTIVAAEGTWEGRVALLAEVPITQDGVIGFQVENALAAVAAAWSLGLRWEVVRAGLATFVNDPRRAPARFNVLKQAGATIIVDYGHNVDALRALTEAIERMPHARRLAVFSCAGDRRDQDIVGQAKILAGAFDEIVLYEDQCNRGRKDGEVTALMRQGLALASRASQVSEVRGEFKAIELGLQRLCVGDLILVLVDQVEPSLAFIQSLLAKLPARPVAAGAPVCPPGSLPTAPTDGLPTPGGKCAA